MKTSNLKLFVFSPNPTNQKVRNEKCYLLSSRSKVFTGTIWAYDYVV